MSQHLVVQPHPGYKASANYWTGILVRLFPLPPLGAFPAFLRLPSAEEAEVIDRFIFQAARLTESAGLNGASGVRNSWSREEGWKVESNFPPYEALTGLAAQFRQLYSTAGQRGNFYAVVRILRGLSSDGGEHQQRRLEMLKVWSKAVAALRSKGARQLADEKLGSAWPADSTALRPETVIDIFLNGEHLHWDERHASELAARAPLPEFEANLRYSYYEAVAPIAYLFILFAYFVTELLRRSVAELET